MEAFVMNAYELFLSIGEPFGAGLFELDAAPIIRYSNALKRFWEVAKMPDYDGGMLYPSGVHPFNFNKDMSFRPHYANTYQIHYPSLKAKSEEAAELVYAEEHKVSHFRYSPHRVGGYGWTHSFPNYARVLREGLDTYRARVLALPESDFREGMLILLEAIDIYHARTLSHLKEQNAPRELIAALERVPYKPARTIYEAMVSLNFTYYIDGCDDIGPLDKILLPYHNGEDIVELIREFFRHVDENDGWSGTLGPDYNEITRMCLRAIHNGRRPNLQLLVTKDMPDWVWEESAASLATSCGQPALYNHALFTDTLHKLMPEIPKSDLEHIAFGGCTETMLEGMSNVGSDDAGMNLALIFSGYMRSSLAECKTYGEFYDGLIELIRKEIATLLDLLNEHRRTRALYRPSVVRTLLIDDCIDRQTEFHAGGARWMWSVINMAGVINIIDSLCVIRELVYEKARYTAEEFIKLLDERDPAFLAACKKCPSYGNDNEEADEIGRKFVDAVTDAYTQRECLPRGKFFPVSNQFTTYIEAGRGIPATPDGRACNAPLCDSLGAIHGNDNKGPTALLNSVSKLPLKKIIGTPITNIRISKEHIRPYLKPLVESFFENGGMQLQVSCLSREEMLDAIKNPDDHKNLVVRVGGFSEYFNRLSPELKQTIIERTEH